MDFFFFSKVIEGKTLGSEELWTKLKRTMDPILLSLKPTGNFSLIFEDRSSSLSFVYMTFPIMLFYQLEYLQWEQMKGNPQCWLEKRTSAAFVFQLRNNNFFTLHLFDHKYSHAHYDPDLSDLWENYLLWLLSTSDILCETIH